jgi:chromosome segregation ATPase
VKTVLITLLAAVGLVPARRHAAAVRQLDEMSRELRVWRKRATAADARRGELERQLRQQVQRLKEMRAAAARKDIVKQRAPEEFKAMQARLIEAERALAIARDQLMAIEVKLDILEGAANVLDARTRTVVTRGTMPVMEPRR